jgi:hypothetical protein
MGNARAMDGRALCRTKVTSMRAVRIGPQCRVHRDDGLPHPPATREQKTDALTKFVCVLTDSCIAQGMSQ